MKQIMANYADDEFRQIVKESTTYTEIAQKIGYQTIAGDAFKKIKREN